MSVDSGVCRTLAVTGYSREVGPGWLEPLLTHPGAVDRLRRQLAHLESSRPVDADRGRLVDPQVEVAAADARDLAARLACGEGRLFRVGLYVTVRAAGPKQLETECARVCGLVASLLLDAHPATFRSLQGWLTTQPLGLDGLVMRRTFDTGLAASFAVVVSTEEFRTGKPAPDVYLAVAHGLGVSPNRCAAIEGLEHELGAARAAGMRVIAIPPAPTGPIRDSPAPTSSSRRWPASPKRSSTRAARLTRRTLPGQQPREPSSRNRGAAS